MRKAKLKPKVDDSSLQSELGRSLGDYEKPLTPPHLMSLPAQNFTGTDLCSRPVSAFPSPSHLLSLHAQIYTCTDLCPRPVSAYSSSRIP